jgi:hypothetical protein
MADEQPWLTLTEAAQRSGLAREAIRARARRKLVPSQRGNRGELLVQLPADLLAGSGQGMADLSAGALAGLPAAIVDLMSEVAELREQLARAEAAVEAARAVAIADVATVKAEVSAAEARAKAEVAAAEAKGEARAAALRELVDELKTQLAEARRPWWQRLLGR